MIELKRAAAGFLWIRCIERRQHRINRIALEHDVDAPAVTFIRVRGGATPLPPLTPAPPPAPAIPPGWLRPAHRPHL
jgi:hypothetical protein